jgi:N-acetylmuramoyl-L-alanine amidase
MGDAQVSLAQAVEFVTQRATGAAYPTDTVKKIVETTWQVAEADGVRADLAIGLMAKETGFFRYGGDVKADQWNFGGIGATGGGVPGVRFPSLEAGVKAVVRRMRMYAVHDSAAYNLTILVRGLPEIGVPADEPGFHGWGKHPNIEDFNGAWNGSNEPYGQSIVAMVETMKAVPVPSEPSAPFTDSEIAWLDNRYVRR